MKHDRETIEVIKNYCINHPAAYEARPFGEYPICYRVMGRIFAQFNPEEKFYKLTLKCEPEKAYLYRQLYPEVVVRGYHCPPVQQPYWNSIALDSFSDQSMLFLMINEAYQSTVDKLRKKDKQQLSILSTLEFKDTDGDDSDFSLLCGQLDHFLNDLVGKESQRSQYNQYNLRDSIHDVILVYQNGLPVACGAFKRYDEDRAELKRIYVGPSIRNMGIGTELIRRLEAKAKILGYRWCILETGMPLQAACHLYEKTGYQIIPNYGPYTDMPASICMERKL